MPPKDDKSGGGEKEPITVEKLQEQMENLNKGIASYRDKAQAAEKEALTAREEAKQAKEEASRIKAAIDKAGEKEDDEDPAAKLSAADQKKLESWAKAQGFVNQKDLEAERTRLFSENLQNVESQAVDEFIKAHPDLNNDEEWKKIKEQFVLYKQPTSLTAYRQVLGRIYKDIYGKDEADGRARADIKTRERLTMGGGSQKDDGGDQAIEDLQKKYPTLDRETIIGRLKEINDLADARKKRQGKK